MDPKCLLPGNPTLIENIVNYLKAKGIFDEFRHECLADVDTKSSYQNLSQRIDGYTSKFLANETWHSDSNKNEMRNKVRRHIDESGIPAIGADIVVDQVFKPKMTQCFYPKIIEIVHQYVNEQNESETIVSSESSLTSEKFISNMSENRDKTLISDPIADILCFNYSKSKVSSVNSTHVKTESVQHKHGDTSKVEKKREEKNTSMIEKNSPEVQGEVIIASVNEAKIQIEKDKDKIKKEDAEIHQDVLKKIVKDEVNFDKKKTDDIKVSVSELATVSEESQSSIPVSFKSNVSLKKDDKNKSKSKSQNIQKSSDSSSEIKKPKKESSASSSEKLNKSKLSKLSKESLSPTKISSSLKSVFKEEKGESSKSKCEDLGCNKTSELSVRKSKSSYDKKDSISSKHKGHSEKTDKTKFSKSVDKNDPRIYQESLNSEKCLKNIHYSSSYDSSQGSDQEKSHTKNLKKERPKHFSKHANKEKSEFPDSSNEIDKKRSSGSDENSLKKYKNEKDAKLKLKDLSAVEAAKISSRSNSFGSTSSVSSSSNASKDNLTSNSDEVSENSVKDKKKKQLKEKDSCQNFSKTLPSPPPPPPPSSSLTSELTSAESVEDTQSSLSESEASSSEEESSEESFSDSELESKDLINDTLNENALDSSTDNINAFYDIFLYSSSSSEFEGYGDSPEKKSASENELENMHESDISISSVHTSDLSSFDDELSCDDDLETGGMKKKLTLKEAQELIKNRSRLNETKKTRSKSFLGEDSIVGKCSQGSLSIISSDDESPPSEPKRLLRRERKLNPRYSSNEYTSIFNCKKETFITKQTSPSVRSPTFTSFPKIESKFKKTDDSFTENIIITKESLEARNENVEMHLDKVEKSENIKIKKESEVENDQLSDSKTSSSDEIDSILDKEKFFKHNNKNDLPSGDDKLKDHKKLKPYNNSKLKRNSHSLKRKLEALESTPVKRPCSRSSVDSSSSEFAPNENRPFNNEKNDFHEEKKLKDCNLKISNLNAGVKKDLFYKQRATNNGDIMGQKDVFSKNSHGKVINNNEKKTNECDTGKELSSL